MSDRDARPAVNPFDITKATDLGDDQINATWVDFRDDRDDRDDGGFYHLADPTSPMPRFLLSGKGGGRTHLMRYFSGPLQLLRAREAGRDVLDDGYLGIYYRCSGLNSGRFAGKGIDDETWAGVFAYYMDLVLAYECLRTATETLDDVAEVQSADTAIAAAIADAFDDYPAADTSSTAAIQATLRELLRELDLAVNNVWQSKELPRIRIGRGRLPFVVPQAIDARLGGRSITWLYLVDELENLTEDQQVYLNTLIREKQLPASFMVGSRLYGFRTRRTYSADEENKEGSEYDTFYLDRTYFKEHDRFKRFCQDLVARRLIKGEHVPDDREQVVKTFPEHFFRYPDSRFHEAETRFAVEAGRRPHLMTLASQLRRERAASRSHALAITTALAIDRYPLLEKLNVFLLYQEWSRGTDDLLEAAIGIQRECEQFVAGRPAGRYASAYKHRKADLLAHLLWQYRREQRYLGFDTFVRMASGYPRNLMVILKYIFRETIFSRERGLEPGGISEATQLEAAHDAAEWFFEDAKPMGAIGDDAQGGVRRLGDLLRSLRYADKPPEVSLTTFSVYMPELTERAQRSIKTAVQWSMLVEVRGRRERNTGEMEERYQLSPMLAPRWDLPLVRRGDIGLSREEANAIFDPDQSERFDEVQRARLARVNVPFRAARSGASPPQQTSLPDELR